MWIRTADGDVLVNAKNIRGTINICAVDKDGEEYLYDYEDETPVGWSIFFGALRIGGIYSTKEKCEVAFEKLIQDITHKVKVIEMTKGDLE